MKNRQKTKKSLHKISSFLRSIKSKHISTTDSRRQLRILTGRTKSVPSSTKIGKGNAYRKRTYNSKKPKENIVSLDKTVSLDKKK